MKLDKRGRIVLSEAQVSEQILGFLRAEGWRVHPLHAEQNFNQRRDRREVTGCPDYAALHPDAGWFYIECKRLGGKVRKAQIAFRLAALRDGCRHIIADHYETFVDWYRREFANGRA